MKILAISLLRFGDILMHLPALSKLKAHDPEASIHIIINDAFRNMEALIVGVDKIHYFPRSLLQSQMNDSYAHILNSVYHLKDLVRELNAEKYDKVYNYTQNRLSGVLTELIEAQEKKGTVFKNSSFQIMNSKWFKYLNETISDKDCQFHFSDLVCEGDASLYTGQNISLSSTYSGELEYETLNLSDQPIISYQFSTSDIKKNLNIQKATEILLAMKSAFPNHQHMVLLFPQETFTLPEEIKSFHCSLAGAYSALIRSELLVTVDTGIKHMAAFSDVPVVELCLGSSIPQFTSTLSDQSYILTSAAECAPCTHSSPCSKKSHECEEIFHSAETIVKISENILKKTQHQVYSDHIYKLHRSPFGYVLLQSQKEKSHYKDFIKEIEKFSTFTYLKETPLNSAKLNYHQSALLSEFLLNIYSDLNVKVLVGYFQSFYKESKLLDEKLREFEYQLITNNQINDDLLFETPDSYSYLKPIKDFLGTKVVSEYSKMRKIQKLIIESKSKLNIRIQLYGDLVKWGGEYESRTRSLPGGRAQEA